MEAVRRAVIDVGTNSIKLLVADIAGRQVDPVCEESQQTRLGEGFYDTHRLQPGPIAKTGRAVADFAAKAREHKAAAVRVIATSAARDAVNAAELTSAIEQASGLKVEIISGDQEADWVFQGVTTDPALAREPLLLLDVGGGSTEFILGQGAEKHFRKSFPLGTVRLLAKLSPGDPPKPEELTTCRQWVREFLQTKVKPSLDTAIQREVKRHANQGHAQLVGTGGTASILGGMEAKLDSFDRQRLEATRLSLERVRWQVERLWSLPLEKRKEITGLPPNRADVILTGAVIYEGVLEEFGFGELRISTRGLRFAAVMADGGKESE
ncbi:MAG TPA: Ppx/GppA phosphatase family protein [Candidatus Binatia bacterium]|jgi:exopolyphosphatase/guanosine-5'-triphosphate,3'-diphosphate pyrophosphatase|nr:Ppx/GppA phosphatase family protein [Candidatus Binatia bacterium]